ncbi:MAG: hypothetical protein ACXW6J_09680 [Candidatus Binatia bacterium]
MDSLTQVAELTARPFYRADKLKPRAIDNHAVMFAGAEGLPDLSVKK